jgi:hypothetical protein
MRAWNVEAGCGNQSARAVVTWRYLALPNRAGKPDSFAREIVSPKRVQSSKLGVQPVSLGAGIDPRSPSSHLSTLLAPTNRHCAVTTELAEHKGLS